MHLKKIIAPVIITLIVMIYLIVFIWGWSSISIPFMIKIIGLIIPIGLMFASVYVLIERIKEIRSGEEDDLSKY